MTGTDVNDSQSHIQRSLSPSMTGTDVNDSQSHICSSLSPSMTGTDVIELQRHMCSNLSPSITGTDMSESQFSISIRHDPRNDLWSSLFFSDSQKIHIKLSDVYYHACLPRLFE